MRRFPPRAAPWYAGHTTQERFRFAAVGFAEGTNLTEAQMHGLIYLIGLIVVILAILSFFGLR
jgi:hypothetical protein